MNITVGTTPVPIPLESAPRGPRWSQGKLLVTNLGLDTVYLGRDSDVTTGTGFPIPTGAIQDLSLDLISEGADTDVRYFV